MSGAAAEPQEAGDGDREDTLDRLLSGRDPRDAFPKDGQFDELKKALAERVLDAELDDHLKRRRRPASPSYLKKTVLTETSKIEIKIPRDREEIFAPKLLARYRRRFPGFHEKIVSTYAGGMTTRDIKGLASRKKRERDNQKHVLGRSDDLTI